MSLNAITTKRSQQAYQLFETCCCSPRWIEQMVEACPFADLEALLNASTKSFARLNDDDFILAFEGHPQIGDLKTLEAKYANTSDSASNEQAGMSSADKLVIEEMYTLNQRYLKKFGFIFIVCASGKSAQQMLTLIKNRINNDRTAEIRIAANEQIKITQLRLEKLL